MEMDLGTGIIGLIMVVLFALPFVLDARSRAKRKKDMLGGLQAIAQQHQCTVEQHEYCGDAALGLDTKRKAVLFFAKREGGHLSRYVDLNTIRACRVGNTTSTSKGDSGEVVTERVELHLVPADKNAHDIRLELFHSGTGASLNGELQFADKWARLVTAQLKHK